MIYLFFHGGLGNQFFQYAFGRALQIKCNDKVTYTFEPNIAGDLRELNIEHFNINPDWSRASEGYDFWQKHIVRSIAMKSTQKIGRFLDRKNKSSEDYGRVYLVETGLLNRMGIYTHYLHRYPPIRKAWTNTIVVDGLWNDPKYSIDLQALLAEELTLKDTLCNENRMLLDSIKETNSVCVHVRRGDYVYVPGYLVCTPYYYEEAIRQIQEEIDTPVFYVFSDDISWCQENISWPSNTVFVDRFNPDYIDISLMSACSHFIISNSTFSWWAAYLGKTEKKIVFAPDKWYNDGKTKKQMILPEWKIIRTDQTVSI